MELYHSGNSDFDGIVKAVFPFFGVFASTEKDVADSHNNTMFCIEIEECNIATSSDIDSKEAVDLIKTLTSDENEFEEIYNSIVFDKGLFSADISEERLLEIFCSDSVGEADWTAQGIRGKIAKKLGYKAVEMKDEHGTTYLILSENILKRMVD